MWVSTHSHALANYLLHTLYAGDQQSVGRIWSISVSLQWAAADHSIFLLPSKEEEKINKTLLIHQQ